MRALPRTRPCRAAFIAVVAPALRREINPSVGGLPVRRAPPMPAISTVTLCEHVRTWRRPLGRHSGIYMRTSGAYFVCSTPVGVLHRLSTDFVTHCSCAIYNLAGSLLLHAEVEVGSIVGGTPVRIIRCMYVCSVCMLWHVMDGWLFGSVNFGL
jgi:hypothetical protein